MTKRSITTQIKRELQNRGISQYQQRNDDKKKKETDEMRLRYTLVLGNSLSHFPHIHGASMMAQKQFKRRNT
uniref:Uncharacterized protein n=1 Tax=Onchocerca volvulus TaxID=6282 RepID=A0A8R1TJP9_ONCVO